MWEAIAYVSSGFTLAAFIASVVAWTLKVKSEEKGKLIALADTDKKSRLVQDALEFFHVNSENLNKEQQFHLALEQIKNRASRFRAVTILIGFVSILAAAISAYAIGQANSREDPVGNDYLDASTSQEKTVTKSSIFEKIISDPADMNRIRQFIEDNFWVLGASNPLTSRPVIENVRDFPIQDGLVPNFTRFKFGPQISQLGSVIIFFDFISPNADIFKSDQSFTPYIERKIYRLDKYISAGNKNYKEYAESATKLNNFSIPLSVLQRQNGLQLVGRLVVGRRGRLSAQQLEYLSNFNKDRNNDKKIITYDTFLDYIRRVEKYKPPKEND